MKIGIFSPPNHKPSEYLLKRLNAVEPDSATRFDMGLNGDDSLSINAGGLYWNGVDISRLSRAFIMGFSYQDPIIPKAEVDTEWSVWQTGFITDQQKYSVFQSLFQELERRSVRVINPFKAHLTAFMKPYLLEELRQSGFFVPEMVSTNHREVAEEFREGRESVLWRPSTGRAAYQLFKERQRDFLISGDKPPIILAEVTEGPLIRTFVYEGRPLLCLKFDPPASGPPESLENFWEVECPEGVMDDLLKLSRTTGLRWVQVLFVERDGRPVIYDLDADPTYHWLPKEHRERLEARLATMLLSSDPYSESFSTPREETVRERPTPYLRRMLRVLFDIEGSKYR